ncbi:hypothetical protein TNCT_318181 [Trichonephila clavata]|uniref:Uncharacterized protein n=1 Tax=Trichonephila clavata TaxID=2740835 RepID=A0A8X6J9D6_TRICU|nr:hypothetical protein TNCT_318181 [Trichonephila clavata]
MCEGLGRQAQLAAEQDRKLWVLKKKLSPIPKGQSKTILIFCNALSRDAELAHSTGREHLQKYQSKRVKPLLVVHSIKIF